MLLISCSRESELFASSRRRRLHPVKVSLSNLLGKRTSTDSTPSLSFMRWKISMRKLHLNSMVMYHHLHSISPQSASPVLLLDFFSSDNMKDLCCSMLYSSTFWRWNLELTNDHMYLDNATFACIMCNWLIFFQEILSMDLPLDGGMQARSPCTLNIHFGGEYWNAHIVVGQLIFFQEIGKLYFAVNL